MRQDLCKYVVVKFVEDPIKNEPVNLGVLVHQPATRFLDSKFLKDLRSKLSKRGNSEDQKIIRDFIDFFRNKQMLGAITLKGEEFLNTIYENSKGKRLQLTEPRAIISLNPDNELKKLYEQFIGKCNEDLRPRIHRFQTELKDRFKDWEILASESEKKHRLVPNVEIEGSAGVKHTIQFGNINGKTIAVEAIDLRTRPVTQERESMRSTLKMCDLSKHLKTKFIGISVIHPGSSSELSHEAEKCLKILKGSGDVYDFEKNAGKLKKDLKELLG